MPRADGFAAADGAVARRDRAKGPFDPHEDHFWLAVLWGAVLAGAALSFGTVHPVARTLLTVATTSVGLASLLWRAPQRRIQPLAIATWGLVLVSSLLSSTAFIPLGARGRAALQPGYAALLEDSLALANTTLHPLALDPHGALVSWSAAAGALVFTAGTYAWVRGARSSSLLAQVIAGVGGVVGLLAIAQKLTSAPSIYWGTGVGGAGRHDFVGPFVYQNHGAVFLGMTGLVALCVGLDKRSRRRALLLGAAAVCGLAVVLARSRGGLLATALGGVVALFLAGSARVRVGVLALFALLLVWLAAMGPTTVLTMLTTVIDPAPALDMELSGGRIALWSDVVHSLSWAPWLGVGAGGFHDAFLPMKSFGAHQSYTHAHQEWLQAAVEHGLPFVALWIGAATVLLVAGLRTIFGLADGSRRLVLSGFLGALVTLLCATLFDFPLRAGAIAALTAALVGGSAGMSFRSQRPPPPWTVRALTLSASLLAAAALLTAGLSFGLHTSNTSIWGSSDAALAQADVARTTGSTPATHASALAAYRVALRRRPFQMSALLGTAEIAYRDGDLTQSLEVLGLARRIYPTSAGAWLATARVHRERGALGEARDAYRHVLDLHLGSTPTAPLIREALALSEPPTAHLDELLPENADRRCEVARELHLLGHDAEAYELYVQEAPSRSRCAVMWAEDLLDLHRPEEALDAVALAEPGCGQTRTRGLIRVELGDYTGAIDDLRRSTPLCGEALPRTRIALGQALAHSGDEQGLAMIEAVILEYPTSVRARRAAIASYQATERSSEAIPHLEQLFVSGQATWQEIELLALLTKAQ